MSAGSSSAGPQRPPAPSLIARRSGEVPEVAGLKRRSCERRLSGPVPSGVQCPASKPFTGPDLSGLDIVKNISASGMYLVTRERWPEGEVNPVRLVYQELADDAPDNQVTLQTKAVRWGEDGMGLTFILPECMDLWLWKTVRPHQARRYSQRISPFQIACLSAPYLPCGNPGTEAAVSRRAEQYSHRKRRPNHPTRRSNARRGARF